ncbi:hypothetical protein [Flavobacterium flavigenum]|uniref:hypothetical protein n=1 Tax=Flavobacterium flavigenum TaxID=3003258 RepID=UPI0022ABE98A|nr:hypothetical protein [Flavobacterium flavigenum]
MKKITLILCAIILTACTCKKETKNKEIKYDKNISKLTLNDFNGDTLAYVQTKIIDRKEYYIGKKFKVLIDDFNIPIKFVVYSGDDNNITKVSSTAFLIYDGFQIKNKLNKGEIPVNLIIEWNPALNKKDLDKLNKEINWTPEKEAYFSEQIIGNLGRTNYPGKK